MRLWKYIGEFLAFRWVVNLLRQKPERKAENPGDFRWEVDEEAADRWEDCVGYDGDSDIYGSDDSIDFFHEEQEDFDSFDF